MIDTLNQIATTRLKPDLTLVFLMSDKYFSSRGEYLFSDRLEREDKEFRQNMRQGYKNLVEKTENAYLLDADADVDAIHGQVVALLEKCHITDLCPSQKS